MNIHSIDSLKKKDDKEKLKKQNVGGGSSYTETYVPDSDRPELGSPSQSGILNTKDIVETAKRVDSNSQRENLQNDGDSSVVKIVMYKNAIVFDDNEKEFFDCDSSAGQKILKNLKEGIIPREIESRIKIREKNIKVDLVDRTDKDFKPSSFVAFKGVSHSVNVGSALEDDSSFFFPAEVEPRLVTADQSKPSTTLQIVTFDQKVVKATMNRDHTVFDLYCHVMKISGAPIPFQLLSGFPPKPLSNFFDSLEEAKLCNVKVIQRVVNK